ncbi:MAG: NTP transferase domain-containing protein, partial [Desulfovibrionaceae bacterium]
MGDSVIYGFVFARGGSKGVPGKNLRPLGGRPLVARAVETGLACPRIDRMFVSTDDPAIAEAARAAGAEVPFLRPAELAGDKTPERLAWRHAIQALGGPGSFDVFVSLPCTAPLRAVADVDACLDRFLEGGADTVIAVTEAAHHPSFNMVRLDDAGYAALAMPLPGGVANRQQAPRLYDITTVAYVTTPEFVLRTDSYFQGRVRTVTVPAERALDIDTELDLAFAEFLLDRQA